TRPSPREAARIVGASDSTAIPSWASCWSALVGKWLATSLHLEEGAHDRQKRRIISACTSKAGEGRRENGDRVLLPSPFSLLLIAHAAGAAAFPAFTFAENSLTPAAAATKATTTSFFAAKRPASSTLKNPALVARAP